MRKKVITVAAIVLAVSTVSVGCGSTIQKVSGTINDAIQTQEFADAADGVADVLWKFATQMGNALGDFCKDTFGGDSNDAETPDTDSTESDDADRSEEADMADSASTEENNG